MFWTMLRGLGVSVFFDVSFVSVLLDGFVADFLSMSLTTFGSDLLVF